MFVVRLGYTILIVAVLLMTWAAMSGARDVVLSPAAYSAYKPPLPAVAPAGGGPPYSQVSSATAPLSAPGSSSSSSSSSSSAAAVTSVSYPPCYFNPLCSCSKAVPDLGIVLCRDVPLPRVPPAINESRVFMLHLQRNDLRQLEPYFLHGTGLYRLEVSENPMADLPDDAFSGLERSLWELALRYDRLVSVPSRALRYLQKLRLLDLTGNEISDLSSESFRGVESSLQTLVLADNDLSYLSPSAFRELPQLHTLDLRRNSLMGLDPQTFDGATSQRLARVILSDNSMNRIPYEAVASLRALKLLDLSRNRISHLGSYNPQTPLYESNLPSSAAPVAANAAPGEAIPTGSSSSASPSSLSASSSPSSPTVPSALSAVSTPDAEPLFEGRLSLDSLHLEYNQIGTLPQDAFRHFDIVNQTFLDGNPIDEIQGNALRDVRMRELSFRDCGISYVSPSALAGLQPFLQALDLGGNNITILPPDFLHRFDSLRALSLKDTMLKEDPGESLLAPLAYSLHHLDLGGKTGAAPSTSSLARLRGLRALSLSRLPGGKTRLEPELFQSYGPDVEELRMVGAKLAAIPNHAFRHLRGLRRLDLSENSISTIENEAFDDIGHSLRALRLSRALSLSSLPSEAFRPLTDLQMLDLGGNRLRSFPEATFHFMRSLRILALQDNEIEDLPKGTFQPELHNSLRELRLSFNALGVVRTGTFADLASLELIYMDDNRIARIEESAFANLPKLRYIDLRGNKIETMADESFQNLPELEVLDMAYNSLTRLDLLAFDQVGTLSSFHLNASHNLINELSVNTSVVVRTGGFIHANVRVLDVSHNNISHVERGYMSSLAMSLTHLHMSFNKISNATREAFGSLPHLQWLDLGYNDMRQLEYDAFRGTRHLQVLHADHNDLTDLPSEVFRTLSSLRVVDLSHNRLRSLPDGLFQDAALERLDLSHNMLVRAPSSALGSGQSARTMRELDISWNGISSLHGPDSVARLKSLTWLDISHNRLSRLEDSAFAQLPRLESLFIGDNPSLDPRSRTFEGLQDNLLELSLEGLALSSTPDLPLPSLRYLDLSRNAITIMPAESTANLTSLRRLDVGGNRLRTLPATYHLHNLRSLLVMDNPIPAVTDIGLTGAERLEELDVRRLPLNSFETGCLGKMRNLHTIRISPYREVRDFNISRLLRQNPGLRTLHVEVHDGDSLGREMQGPMPTKLENITLTGNALKTLSPEILEGIRGPVLHLSVHNTSIDKLPTSLFRNMGRVRNISLDVRNNSKLRSVGNPSNAEFPGVHRKTFLTSLRMSGNPWNCDCELGWVETWERKKRLYLCEEEERYPDRECRGAPDDLRETKCDSKANASIIEVFKTDLECGWSSAVTASAHPLLLALLLFLLPAFRQTI
ncbi:chaoptin isoform X2 [Hetaerina americana]|uniref:chaoptin isoform X2 n=1 Tax=Hetaerina americana TaxID=62018 RepID=UPI003A7F2283